MISRLRSTFKPQIRESRVECLNRSRAFFLQPLPASFVYIDSRLGRVTADNLNDTMRITQLPFLIASAVIISAPAALATDGLLSGPTSKVTADGLEIVTANPKTCKRPTKSGDNISVHYSGKLQSNGIKFDESYKRGVPFSFKLGVGEVIKGWDQGLMDMCVGEKRKLVIPPELAYGHSDMGIIPPDSTLSMFLHINV